MLTSLYFQHPENHQMISILVCMETQRIGLNKHFPLDSFEFFVLQLRLLHKLHLPPILRDAARVAKFMLRLILFLQRSFWKFLVNQL